MQISASIQPELLYPLLPPLSLLDKDGNFIFHSEKAAKVIRHWNPQDLPKNIKGLNYPELTEQLGYHLEIVSVNKESKAFKIVAPNEEDHILSFQLEVHPNLSDTYILYLPQRAEPYLSQAQNSNRFFENGLDNLSIPEATFYNNALGLTISGLDGIIHRVNKTFAQMLAYEPDELEGRSFYELNHPSDTPPNKELVQKLLRGEVDWITFEKRYIRKDGRIVWSKLWVRHYEDANTSFLISTIQDISEEKKRAEQLKRQQQQIESIFSNTLVGITLVSTEGDILSANPAFEKIIGYTETELKQLAFRELTHPEDRGYNHQLRQQVINQEAPYYSMIKRYIRKDGQIIWVNLSVSGLINENNEIKELVGTVVNISEEKIQAQKLQQSEKRYRLIANNTQDLISLFSIAEEAKINFLSPSVKSLLGYPAEELTDTPWTDLVHPDDRSFVAEILMTDLIEKTVTRYRVNTKSGQTIWLESVFVPVRSAQGELLYLQANSRNITDSVKAEIALDMKVAELDDANRKLKQYISSNSELEKFAYIASHDLREPLRTIIGFTQILASRYRKELKPEANQFLDLILDASKHMHQLVQDLLHYSRVSNESMDYQEIALPNLIRRLRSDLEETIIENNGVLIVLNLPSIIFGHETGLYRVFLNLISNSIKFRRKEVAPEIVISGFEEEDHWHFSISDNGIGIAADYHEQIFLLFKRLHSKVDYEGSGLGLPICRKIIDRHQGKIWVESTPNVGSTFHFTVAKSPSVSFR